ncbi:hypothetical protein Ancab_022368 [Ancistrocladus abbreviatus]
MTTGMIQDQNLEKQIEKNMGCMAGFFNLFDRTHILAGKRFYAKRLPPSSGVVDSTTASEAVPSVGSPSISRELAKPPQQPEPLPSPDRSKKPSLTLEPAPEDRSRAPEVSVPVVESIPPKSPLAVSSFEFKESVKSPWKFTREAPRLSLDSRAVVDAKGSLHPREIRTDTVILSEANGEENEKQRRSPSVIARLMGLEPLAPPNSSNNGVDKTSLERKAELRRSASESRSRDLIHCRFIESNSFLQESSSNSRAKNSSIIHRERKNGVREFDKASSNNIVRAEYSSRSANSSEPLKQRKPLMQQRRSYYDTADFFPEPKQQHHHNLHQRSMSIYGEIERRLKMRGIDEPYKDLETLKQILEALQLKGLLHSKPSTAQIGQRNFVYERRFEESSPIVVMKPVPPAKSPASRRLANESLPPGFRSKVAANSRSLSPTGEALQSMSPRERPEVNRNAKSQMRNSSPGSRSENRSSSPVMRRKPLRVETQRRANEAAEQRRGSSPVQSPKLSWKRTDQTTSGSPRNRRATPEICSNEKLRVAGEDESSTMSESSYSTSSYTDTERWKMEEHREGRSLLERCDKLLHSIAEITAPTELQPSPVSVLDSSFCKEEDSPSPVMKRTLVFKDQMVEEFEDEMWSPSSSAVQGNESDGSDFIYVSEILRASNYLPLPDDSNLFLLLEKQQLLKGKDTSKASALQRKLIFDTITEILERNRQLPPWKLVSPVSGKPTLKQIWSELQRIRERGASEDLFETICEVLRRDLAGDVINVWGDRPVEVSEAVLDIERLIFKDLIGETIRDLALFTGKSVASVPPRRKLVF